MDEPLSQDEMREQFEATSWTCSSGPARTIPDER